MLFTDALLRPQSVAIIGASNDATRIGGRPVHYLLKAGYQGAIYPISLSQTEVQGLKAYPSVENVSGPIDCAVIMTPTKTVLSAVEACVRKSVKCIVILTAGFAEMGEAGKRLQDEIAAVARKSGIRIVGPNCLGIFNTAHNNFLTFSGVVDDIIGTKGRVGMVSQSGGYGGDVVKQAKHAGLNFGSWVTTGNEADVEAGELVEAFAQDDNIDVIVAYLESVRSSGTLIAGLSTAWERRKPVIVMKVGRSSKGAQAAVAHTASLAGADNVYDAVFSRYGAYRARTTEEMLDIAYAVSKGKYPAGNRLLVITLSGGVGVMAADFADDEGLEMPQLPNPVRSAITEMVPNAGTQNPIDLTAQPVNDPELCARALDAALASGAYDMAFLNLGMLGGMAYATDRLVNSLKAVAERYPHVPMAIGTMVPPDIASRYEAAGYLQFVEPARALRSLAGLQYFARAWSRPLVRQQSFETPMPAICLDRPLSEAEAKRYIAEAGIPVPAEYLVQDAAEATDAAKRIAGPVAIKIVSPDLPHKTEVGGVALNVPAADAGRRVEEMRATVTASAPNARIEGFLITPMIGGGIECFVGAHVDPVFGVAVTFGLGGIAVELYRDVTTRVAPINRAVAQEMISSIKGAAMLRGFRGAAAADVEALSEAIVRITALAQANADRIGTIEINPLLVFDEGKGVVALDAVITA